MGKSDSRLAAFFFDAWFLRQAFLAKADYLFLVYGIRKYILNALIEMMQLMNLEVYFSVFRKTDCLLFRNQVWKNATVF